jgi:hypothetical protein
MLFVAPYSQRVECKLLLVSFSVEMNYKTLVTGEKLSTYRRTEIKAQLSDHCC